MNAKQFSAALETLGIENHVQAAVVLGISRRSAIRYAHGEQDVCHLIIMLQRHGVPKEWQS